MPLQHTEHHFQPFWRDKVPWRNECLITGFLLNISWKGVTCPGKLRELGASHPEPAAPNTQQMSPWRAAGLHKSSLAVSHWKCNHPRSVSSRNLSLTNWHSLISTPSPKKPNKITQLTNQCWRRLKGPTVLFIGCVSLLLRSEKTVPYIPFNINAHYCYFDGKVNELESVL